MATWLSGISKQHRVIRKNVFLWFGLYLIAFALITVRLAWLQVVEGRQYLRIANAYHTRVVPLRAERGKILDRNLAVLALDDMRKSLYADPSIVQYPDFVAEQLAAVIGQPKERILAKLTQRTLRGEVTAQVAESVRQLNLPGVLVTSIGTRVRVGVDISRAKATERQYKRLAGVLGIPLTALKKELGLPVKLDTAGSSIGLRWLHATYPASARPAIEKLAFPGLMLQTFSGYRVAVDQRYYLRRYPPVPAALAARQLAPLLGKSRVDVQHLLLTRARYTTITPELTEEMQKQLLTLQSTMFIVEPGKLLDGERASDDTPGQLPQAVERLHDMLNPKRKKGAAAAIERITAAEIRSRLLPGAQPGPLAVKSDTNGLPDISIPRRLFSAPIAGVMYGLPGISQAEEPRRHYWYRSLAAATLGWVGDVQVHPRGVFGIEQSEEQQLRGIDGVEVKEIDARRRTIPERSTRKEPVNGRNIVLTLDLTIQQAAEEELAKQVTATRALRGQCIVIDPNTGEILAMATYPSWDANAPGKRSESVPLVNTAISNFYEPGSTFKVVAVIGALEEKLVRDGETVTTCSGPMPVGKRFIHESHNYHGPVDCSRLLEQSCNIGAATLALRLRSDDFLNWCDKFGFGQRTGVELDQESPGYLNRKNAGTKITLANMGFGQSLAVTPLQMAVAYSVIANGGEWIQPHLLKRRQNADGSWTDVKVPRHRVCSSETTALVRKYLERVVSHGTGKREATIEGYRVGGKTGTAQKAGPHGYGDGYIGSFIGVMPIDKPEFVVIAVIDDPKSSIYGGVVAGPVVREVGRRALQYRNIPPDPSLVKPTGPAQ